MPLNVILDGDPGHDDAINFLLALTSPELTVLGVTTTYGNVGLARTTKNALGVLALAGSDLPVYPGADRPLIGPRLSAESVHGESGLDGPALPAPRRGPESLHAAQFIAQTVLEHPHQVTLLPTGPLTNVALALRLEPGITALIRRIVWMGGSTGEGNWTPGAEFNALCDPLAARMVFESGVPITMFGLNATHQAIATPRRIRPFRDLGTRAGEFTAQLLEFFAQHHRERYGWEGGALHDPMTAACLLRPALFGLRSMHVTVDTTNGPNRGRTVCDLWGLSGRPANAEVAETVDADGFFALLLERIGRLG